MPTQGPPQQIVEAYFGDDFVPCHDMVLIECLFIGQQGSVIIPDLVRNKQQTCRVVRTGPGRITESGYLRPPCCKPGDYVFALVPKGIQFPIGNRHFVILNSSDIIGVFPTPPPNIIESEENSEAAALKAKEEREATPESNGAQPPPAE